MTNITVKKGIIVLRNDSKLITLNCDICIEAERTEDGGYIYTVGKYSYFASAGTVEVNNG